MQNSFFSNTLIINILEKPNIYSNISSQILYGEKFKILSKTKKFYKIKTLYDNYIGFISKKIHIRSNFKPTHKVKKIKSKVYFGLQNKKKNLLTFGFLLIAELKLSKRKEILLCSRKING